MKTISIHSNKGMHYINAYERSKATCLHDVYKNPSYNKMQAYYDCIFHAENHGAENMRIIGHNSSIFSCAARNKDGLIVYTHANTYIVK